MVTRYRKGLSDRSLSPRFIGGANRDRLYLIGKVLGHKQARTTEIYAHLADDPVRAVADRTAARIAAAMSAATDRSDPTKVVQIRRSRS